MGETGQDIARFIGEGLGELSGENKRRQARQEKQAKVKVKETADKKEAEIKEAIEQTESEEAAVSTRSADVKRQRAGAKKSRGRSGTILTGSLGLQDEQAATGKTLLGL